MRGGGTEQFDLRTRRHTKSWSSSALDELASVQSPLSLRKISLSCVERRLGDEDDKDDRGSERRSRAADPEAKASLRCVRIH